MNADYIKRENEARLNAEAEARALLDRAAEESRDLTPEENEAWDKAVAAADAHHARILKLQEMDEAARSVESVRDLVSDATGRESEPPKSTDTLLTEAIRHRFEMIERGGQAPAEETFSFVPAKVPYGSEVRTIESMPGITGQQSEFSRQVGVYARTLSPWIGIARVFNGTEGSPLLLPRLTTDVTTYTPGQGTAITASSPVITNATATPSGYKALSYITQEAAQDDQIGLLDLIAADCGRSIGLSFGSTTTTAVLAGFTNGGTATGTPFFDNDDLIDLIYGRAVPYRQGGVYVMATGAVQKARKFKDSNGQYLWVNSIQAGEPAQINGYPVYEDPNLATPASATSSVLFGQASEYVIKQLPLRVAISTEYAFNTDLVAVKVVYRAGGAVRLSDAMAYLVSGNT